MLDFNSGILRFKKLNGGLDSLAGWTVHAPRLQVGTVVKVLMPTRNRSMHQTLLQTEKTTELTTCYQGVESHLVPLVPAYVHAFDVEKKMILTQLPNGFMELGRRQLILEYLAKELGQLSMEKEMPSRAQLLQAGRSDLLPLIAKAGGFSSTASEINLRWKGRRRNGYWEDPSHLDSEIESLINSSWIEMGEYYVNSMTQQVAKRPMPERGSKRFMPTVSAVKAAKRWDLYEQIYRQGGFHETGKLLGRKIVSKAGRQAIVATRDELMQEIKEFMKERGNKEVLPTESELHQAGRSEIVRGIQRIVGGFGRLAEETGMQTNRRPRSYWKNIENVVKEMQAFVAESAAVEEKSEASDDLIPPKLPTQLELKAAARDDLIYAIRLHGHAIVCRKCGMKEESRGLKKGLLKLSLIEACLDKASPLSLIQLQEKLGHNGVTVTKQHLSNFLKKREREGKLEKVKVSRGLGWVKSLPSGSDQLPNGPED